MSHQIGYLDSDGHPRLTIRITGPDPNNFIVEDALIDTGFTGFLMLPLSKTLALGIVPSATGEYILANGVSVTNLLGTASVTIQLPSTPLPPAANAVVQQIQPETLDGIVVMCGDGALVGMELLRTSDKFLLVGPFVALIDFKEIMAAIGNTPKPQNPN